MHGNGYQCDSCNKTFSRSYNANRHIKAIHKDNALAFNMVTGKSSSEVPQPLNILNEDLLPSGMNFNEYNLLGTPIEEAAALIDIIGKIKKPFETLESSILHIPEVQRIFYLSNLLISSLLSSDPVKIIQDSVDLVQSYKFKNKIVKYISQRNSSDSISAEILLLETFKGGKYYRNRMKFKNKKL